MKKLLGLSLVLMLLLWNCTSRQKDSESSDKSSSGFVSPLESGSYSAVSFQDADSGARRTRFDGRILMAFSEDNSGLLVYENGNRTDFKAAITLTKPFVKEDSVYVAYDQKNRPVTLIEGSENDTLMFTKGEKLVKVAFEKKPLSVMTVANAWAQISEKCK